jgi:hypothetical protein
MKEFGKNQWSGKYLLDGYPRSQENVDVWNKLIGDKVELSFLLFFECSFECMEKRLLERAKTSVNKINKFFINNSFFIIFINLKHKYIV